MDGKSMRNRKDVSWCYVFYDSLLHYVNIGRGFSI